MIAFATQPDNVVFAAALALMLLVGAAELFGLSGAMGDADAGVDGPDWLGWLGLGRVPLSVLMVLFLAVFGSLGLAGQQVAAGATGAVVTGWIAGPAAAAAALPLTGLLARALAPFLPRDETTAVELDELVGRTALIVTGTAAPGSPARARAEDRHGQAHYLMVEPNADTESLREGDAVLLVRREGHVFVGVGRGDARLPRLDR